MNMKNIQTLLMVSLTLLLSACAENASTNSTSRHTQLECDFAGNFERIAVTSGAIDVYYEHEHIKINNADKTVVYPAHACKVTQIK